MKRKKTDPTINTIIQITLFTFFIIIVSVVAQINNF
jgi:hypothetical protein